MIVEIIEYANNVSIEVRGVTIISINENNIPSGITNSVFTQKGEIIVGTGEGNFVVFPPGADGEYLKYDSSTPGGVRTETPVLTVNDVGNKLFNGGFWFAQRQTAGTLTTISDGAYGPDRWKCYRENSDLQYRRVEAHGETGLTSMYYGEFKKITNAGKILVCQPLEFSDSVPLRGRDIIFQMQMKSDVARTIKMAIVQLQTAGTADTIPAVVSAWNVDGTDPTLGANLAFIGTPVSCSVTTSWQKFQFTGTYPSTAKNLVLMIWSNADIAANGTIGFGEAGLYYGSSLINWQPRQITEELQRVLRYFETFQSLQMYSNYGTEASGAYGQERSTNICFKVQKRIVPSCSASLPAGVAFANISLNEATAVISGIATNVYAQLTGVTVSAEL